MARTYELYVRVVCIGLNGARTRCGK